MGAGRRLQLGAGRLAGDAAGGGIGRPGTNAGLPSLAAEAGDADSLHEIMSRSQLPNMWKPRRSNYIKTESIPVLGSGKLDLVKIRKIAQGAKNNSIGE